MRRIPIDLYDDIPSEMRTYLRHYGWHFNKKAYEYACESMRRRNAQTGRMERVEPYTKEQVDELLKKYNITLENNVGYDYVFVAQMCKADYLKSSVADEQHLALYVKDVVDDADAGDGEIMRKWHAAMDARGEIVEWDEIV